MKFSILTLVAALAFATAAPGELVARQCSCHKVGNEWICSGRLCPKDFVPEPAMVKRDGELWTTLPMRHHTIRLYQQGCHDRWEQ
ncbi:hypothetical protein CGMCC3_g15266 [Colletotrichum fructicola]|nr:uncharacterized protein CGMCC3_g15266 [Colletotrichum fructicola]KAE9568578.1 hypothetical protein CGMCC3_g15266 [Colletotrichum fructicola]